MKKILYYIFFIIEILSKKSSIGFNQDGKYYLLNYGNQDVLQEQIGYDITFQCGIKGHTIEYTRETVIKWFYKSCGHNLNQRPCKESFYDDWISLHCENNICNSTLFLKNITEENSGLYKCTIYPYKPNELTLVQTFQLYVRNTTILPPDFLDEFPKNITAKMNNQIVFHCRVYSKEQPTIRWFKRIKHQIIHNNDDNNNSNNNGNEKIQYSIRFENFTHTIPYLENTYEFLNSAGVKILKEDSYFSKLILNSITKAMEGYYACVTINSRGHKIREAYLTVDENNDLIDVSKNTNYLKYLSLFLMPIGLGCLPLSFWLCFVCRKKYIEKRSNIQDDDEATLRINL